MVDAILRVKSLTRAMMEEDEVVLAVLLDITNAFNILSWDHPALGSP